MSKDLQSGSFLLTTLTITN